VPKRTGDRPNQSQSGIFGLEIYSRVHAKDVSPGDCFTLFVDSFDAHRKTLPELLDRGWHSHDSELMIEATTYSVQLSYAVGAESHASFTLAWQRKGYDVSVTQWCRSGGCTELFSVDHTLGGSAVATVASPLIKEHYYDDTTIHILYMPWKNYQSIKMNMWLMTHFQLKNINSYFSDIYPIFPNNLRFYPLATSQSYITQASLKIGCLHQTGGFGVCQSKVSFKLLPDRP